MKKKLKRVLALFLAVAVISSTGMLSSENWLHATAESGAYDSDAATEKEEEIYVEPAEEPAEEILEEEAEPVTETEEESLEEPSEEVTVEAEDAETEEPKKEEPAEIIEEKEEIQEESEKKQPEVSEAETPEEQPVTEAPEQEEDTKVTAPVEEEKAPLKEAEEDKEQQTPAKEEAEEMPVFDFEETAKNGVKVTVHAPEGAFPKGTVMKVSALSDEEALQIFSETVAEGSRAVDARGVDITFYNADGEEIQPEKKIDVRLTDLNLEGDQFRVVHEKKDGKVEVVTEDATADGADFEAANFSPYVAGSEEEIPAEEQVTPADVTEEEDDPILENFFIVADQTEVTVGTTVKITPRFAPNDYAYQEVTWKSSDEEVATVEDGTVTAKSSGPVTITATLVKENIDAQITLYVEEIKVTDIQINLPEGYKGYVVKDETVALQAVTEPEGAKITWESSDDQIASVDENGVVTAVGKEGKATITARVRDEIDGVYAAQEIVAYDTEPEKLEVQYWVTNQYKGTYTILVPGNGGVVDVRDINFQSDGYRYDGVAYFNESKGTDRADYQNMIQFPVRFVQFVEGSFQYTDDKGNEHKLGNSVISLMCSQKYDTVNSKDTNIELVLGDWPGSGQLNNKVTIYIKEEGSKEGDYLDTTELGYFDKKDEYMGKFEFGFDKSKYELSRICLKTDGGEEKEFSEESDSKGYYDSSTGQYSILMGTRGSYEVIVYVQLKQFNVEYELNGGTWTPDPGSSTATADQEIQITDSEPVKEGHFFVGWEYGGRVYQPGDSFTMPIGDVTFNARWESAADNIHYRSADTSKGTVTPSFERLSNAKGAVAAPKEGYVFDHWEGSDGREYETPSFIPMTGGTYIAYFKEESKGEVIYNLTGGRWETTPGCLEAAADGTYVDKNKYYVGDSFEVVDETPVRSDDRGDWVFLGWVDVIEKKDIGKTIQDPGKSLSYIADNDRYELRALWAQINVTDNEYTYDGISHGIKAELSLSESWATLESPLAYVVGGNKSSDVPQYTNAGEYPITCKTTIRNKLVELETKLTINPAALTIAADSKSKPYDTGDPQFTFTCTGLVNGEEPNRENVLTREKGEEVTAEGSSGYRIYIPESNKKYLNNDTFKISNYKITYEDGYLTITENKELKLVVEKYEGVYDKKGHSLQITASAGNKEVTLEYFDEEGNLLDELPVYTNVEDTPVEIRVRATAHGYEPKEATGTVTITKAPIYVTAYNQSKSYGEVDPEFTYAFLGQIGTDIPAFEGTLTRQEGENVGIYEIQYKPDEFYLVDQGSFKASNYEIQYTKGTLEIVKNNGMELVVNNYNELYDGKPHGVDVTKAVAGNSNNRVTVQYSSTDPESGTPGWRDAPVTFTDATYAADGTEEPQTVWVKASAYGYEDKIVSAEIMIRKRSVTLTSATQTRVYTGAPLTKEKVDVTGDGWVTGEEPKYVFTGTQTYVGSSKNTFAIKDEEKLNTNYTITKDFGDLTVTDGTATNPLDVDKVVRKTHKEDGTVYGLNDSVIFEIEVTNIYKDPKTITIQELPGVTLTESTFEDVQPGETVTTTAAYTITEADLLKGSFENRVKVSFGGERDFENTDTVGKDELEEPECGLVIHKTRAGEPENGIAYALGETIRYEITAENTGNVTLTDVIVTDELTGDQWTVETLLPGETSEIFEAFYEVQEADVLAGTVVNTATATGTDPDGNPVDTDKMEPGEEEVPVETEQPSIFLEKTAEPGADGATYGIGEEITYTIRVVNNGNVTVSDITVTDELTGESWTIDRLAPNTAETMTTVYTVTEADIRAGQIVNVATAAGTDPDGGGVDNGDRVTVTTDPADPNLDVEKNVVNPKDSYQVGDTISYEIVVSNRGNINLHNVRVRDILSGTNGSVTYTNLAAAGWKITK